MPTPTWNAGQMAVSLITTLTMLAVFLTSSSSSSLILIAKEGQCDIGCPICIGRTDADCDQNTVYQKCAPQQGCVKESTWSLRGEQLSVIKRCEQVKGQCQMTESEGCSTKTDRVSCVKCTSAADSCRTFAADVGGKAEVKWLFPLIAVAVLLVAILCFMIKSNRRGRDCPDKCVSLCIGHLHYDSTDNATDRRCRSKYRYSALLS